MTEPRREELIEALEPFADEADYLWNKERPDHSDVAAGPTVRLKIKVRDLNRAREVYRALTRAGGKGEEENGMVECDICGGSGAQVVKVHERGRDSPFEGRVCQCCGGKGRIPPNPREVKR